MKTNKIIAGLLSLCIIGGAMPFTENTLPGFTASASAEEVNEYKEFGDMTYAIYSDHATVVDCENTAKGELAIPSKIEGLPVTAVANYTFYHCSELTAITIPNSVTSIGTGAFSYCKSLTSIKIPDGVESIGAGAFSYCVSLTSITIPKSVTSIGADAFFSCVSLTSITIPKSVTSIGACAFSSCESLTSIEFPNSVTSIGYSAFACCIELKSITLPDSITQIETNTFAACISLTSITIPDSVKYIGDGAFEECRNLTSIIIENPECEIYDNEATICNTADLDNNIIEFIGTIYGFKNSTAQAYAEKYNRKFIAIEDYFKGDIDFDGKVDSSDASRVLAEYALTATGHESTFTATQKLFADVNSDSKVDSSDASSILAYYAYKATGGDKTLEEFLKK